MLLNTQRSSSGEKKEHRSHRLYCGFTEEITSKKVRTQDEKKICHFIIHAIYLQLWQVFFTVPFIQTIDGMDFKTEGKKRKNIFSCAQRAECIYLKKSMKEGRKLCPNKGKHFRWFRKLEGLVNILREGFLECIIIILK